MSYQTLYQKANESLTDKNSAWGGWFLLEFSWVAFNKEKDYQGKLMISLDDRHIINSSKNQAPGFFRVDNGSLWATDAAYFDWDIYPGVLLWEQVFKQIRLEIRIGQFPALSFLDFFRYADPRTSFTNSQFGSPVSMIPIGPPGFGATAKWWPIDGSELYIVGLVNDVNATIGKIDWSGIYG